MPREIESVKALISGGLDIAAIALRTHGQQIARAPFLSTFLTLHRDSLGLCHCSSLHRVLLNGRAGSDGILAGDRLDRLFCLLGVSAERIPVPAVYCSDEIQMYAMLCDYLRFHAIWYMPFGKFLSRACPHEKCEGRKIIKKRGLNERGQGAGRRENQTI